MKTVIVVFGNAAAGKSTLADKLAENRPYSSRVCLAFADPLKEAALHLLGIPKGVTYADASVKDSWQTYNKTARKWLQWLGTEVGRNQVHPDVWIHRACDRIIGSYVSLAVISDGRFENERTEVASYLEQKKPGEYRVLNVLVYRPDVPVNLDHQSEAEVYRMKERYFAGEPLFEFCVCNSGTLLDLGEEAKKIVGLATKTP